MTVKTVKVSDGSLVQPQQTTVNSLPDLLVKLVTYRAKSKNNPQLLITILLCWRGRYDTDERRRVSAVESNCSVLDSAELVGRRVWSHLRSSQYSACVTIRRLAAHYSVHLLNVTSSDIAIRRRMMQQVHHTSPTQVHISYIGLI